MAVYVPSTSYTASRQHRKRWSSMDTWIVFAVLLIAQSAYGYKSDSEPPEKIKLTSETRYYYPEDKSDHPREHSLGPSRHDTIEKYQSNTKEKVSEPNYDLYKPQDDHSAYGPTEEDSKYIPHSESYSKYIIPKKNPSSFGKHTLGDQKDHTEEVEKIEEIPRYGFKRENHNSHEHKNFGNEDEDLPHDSKKNYEQNSSEGFQQGSNYRAHPSDNEAKRHYDYADKHHRPYSKQKEQHGKHLYPEYKEEHGIGNGRYPYPEHRDEPKIHQRNHHYPHHKEGIIIPHRSHHYAQHKEEPRIHPGNHPYPHPNEDVRIPHGSRHYPEHKEEARIHPGNHHYPHHKEDSRIPHGRHHYPEHGERHSYHHEGHHNPQTAEKTSYHRTPHHPEHKNEHEDHHDSHPLRYQHWSDKGALSFPKHKTDKWIEELGKGKSHHHVPSEPEGISKHKIFPGVSNVEEFIKGHKLDPHKHSANVLPDKPPHKEHKYPDEPIKGHSLLKHYPHVNKYHREHHIQPFVNYKPSYNFGGHRHGWIYRPKFDLYQELRKDLDVKMRLLKEHEQKLAELQKNHLEKYHALFEPHHAKMFLHHELPKPILPKFDHKGHSHTAIQEEKHEHISPSHKHHSSYSDYPKEEDYPSHKSNYPLHYESPRPHYDDPLPKHDHTDDKPKHYDSHHHKDDYAP